MGPPGPLSSLPTATLLVVVLLTISPGNAPAMMALLAFLTTLVLFAIGFLIWAWRRPVRPDPLRP